MTEKRTAIIVGGGLIGCWTAYYLAKSGWRVTLLERDRLGGGASHGNCGFVCPSHALPLSVPGVIGRTLPSLLKSDAALSIPLRFDPPLWKWLFQFSRQCTQQRMITSASGRNALLTSSMQLYRQVIREESWECQWQDEGLLLVHRSLEDFEQYEKTAELLQREFAIETRRYDGDEVQRLEPALRSGLAGGWHFPGDAHLRPDYLMRCLAKTLTELGVELHEQVSLQSIDVQAGKVRQLQTSHESMTADVVVLAAGAETPKFAKYLGGPIPIQPGKGYSLTMKPLDVAPRIPMIFEQHHVAVTPMPGAFRIGSTMEFTGYDRTINQRRIQLLRKSAADHLKSPIPDEADEQWSGWRPMSVDGLPCLSRTPAAANLFVAAGNGMIGLASAPASGKLIAELASGTTPHVDARPYDVNRFR